MGVLDCPVCDTELPEPFYAISGVPVHCNVLWPSATEALRAPQGDMLLSMCSRCGLIHNVSFTPRLVEYAPGYENSLHCSPRFQVYARDLVDHLVERYALRGRLVAEIGCGRGEFLAMLHDQGGAMGLGFDPSHDGHEEDGVEVVRDFYAPSVHGSLAADLVCVRHVLEHVADPRRLLADVREGLGSESHAAVYVEVPDAAYTFRDLGIWDLIYEHCSYFSAPAMDALLRRTGYRPDRSWTEFGGQFLCVEAEAAGGPGKPLPPGRDWPLDADVRAFPGRAAEKLDRWNARLDGLVSSGRRVAVWGAGSKGATFLNVLDAGAGVGQVVDINPRKAGLYVPGTGQQVVTPEEVEPPDVVIVMNPQYKMEIAGSLVARGISAELLVA
jgi:SAM-dependent methyltransferase